MLEVRHLSKVFPPAFQALTDVSVSLPDGQLVAVIGLSGAGKSTFLRCINRLHDATSGEIVFDGTEVNALPPSQLIHQRRKIGFIFQHFNLVKTLTARQNVLMGRLGFVSQTDGVFGRFSANDHAVAEKCLVEVGLGDKIDKRADQLSGGQQQRVAIARAFAQEPRLILADEPMASLDPRLSDTILSLLKKPSRERGITVLVNIHVIDLAMRYADRILGFNRGKLVFDGTPAELNQSALDAVYAIDDLNSL